MPVSPVYDEEPETFNKRRSMMHEMLLADIVPHLLRAAQLGENWLFDRFLQDLRLMFSVLSRYSIDSILYSIELNQNTRLLKGFLCIHLQNYY